MLKTKINYQFLSKAQLKSKVNELLSLFQRSKGIIAEPPIPIDEIVESHLKIPLDFDNLEYLSSAPEEEILGAIDFDKNKILVSETLDPYEYPSLKGRYAFTLAHEVGHFIIHKSYFEPQHKDQTLLPVFEKDDKPSIICRSGITKPIEEKQADCFAAYLLMPEEMIYKAFRRIKPGYSKAALREMPAIVRELANYFAVSKQAMEYRLKELELIEKNDDRKRSEKFFGGAV